MECVIETDDGLTLRRRARDLDRVFDCFSAGVCQKRFGLDWLGMQARKARIQPLA